MAHILISETDLSELIKKAVVSAISETQTVLKADNTLLTQKQAAEKLNISIPTLIVWKNKNLIPYTQIGRKIYFKTQDVLNAIGSMSSKHKTKG